PGAHAAYVHLGNEADERHLGAGQLARPLADDLTAAHGTHTGARSASRSTALSAPPHTQPVSRPMTPCSRTRPSADQWPKMMRASRLSRCRCANQGRSGEGGGGCSPFMVKSTRPS